MRELLPQIEQIIVPIIEDSGCELVDIVVAGVGSSSVLRVFVHRDGGLNIDEIAKLSRKISEALDVADIVHHRYFLEVSSPGLDRPLHSIRDFSRNIGENVRIVKHSGETFEGELLESNSDVVVIEKDGRRLEIPVNEISVGKIII